MKKNNHIILNKKTAINYLAQRLDCTVGSLSFLFNDTNRIRPSISDMAIPDERFALRRERGQECNSAE